MENLLAGNDLGYGLFVMAMVMLVLIITRDLLCQMNT